MLTLGPNLLLQQTGYYAQLSTYYGNGGDQIVNQGTIDAGTATAQLTRLRAAKTARDVAKLEVTPA